MKESFNLSASDWNLYGTAPFAWQQEVPRELGRSQDNEIFPLPVEVPGSVQKALRNAGLLPDWNIGLNCRECEWVENRHWIFETMLPIEKVEHDVRYVLVCRGLDHAGWIRLNGQVIGTFDSAFVPHRFDLTDPISPDRDNTLQIIFDTPPRYQGQMGHTSACTVQKPRFYYTWDWMPRIVQTGIWDEIFLQTQAGAVFEAVSAFAGADSLIVQGRAAVGASELQVSLYDDDGQLLVQHVGRVNGAFKAVMENLPVERWWPNGLGSQKLYSVVCELKDAGGTLCDVWKKRVGFRSIEWKPCADAPPEADPWLCIMNGRPVFLQGVNWTPVLPNFADTAPDQYVRLLELYRDMGCNTLRMWGGATLEKQCFYYLCDELGLLVWQEFPLCSSGTESLPPGDSSSIKRFTEVAVSYVERLQHHACILMWCGGNELAGPDGIPCSEQEPLLDSIRQAVLQKDPLRRFVLTSPSGPSLCAQESDFGGGIHWDVHGPWKNLSGDLELWRTYWQGDDALFRSEVGAAGASSLSLIRTYAGTQNPFPSSNLNPLWRRTSWWTDWDVFCKQTGREPTSLEEYIEWSQEWQAQQLVIAAEESKRRFPSCGGFLVWMGHDAFPCTANTSVIDFDLSPKPAYCSLRKVFSEGSAI